jgi:HlyD family secretion protein
MEHNYFQKKIAFTRDRIRKNEIHYGNMLRQRNLIKEQLAISKKQFARDSTLNTKGVLANEDLEKNRLQNLQCCLSLEDIQMSLETLQMQMTQMQESLLDVEYQYVERKNTLESQLKSQVSQLLSEIQSWELNNVLAASIAGKVSFTKYWNENQNITGGEEVFNIVPTKNGTLIGKAQLPTARSGKVKVGQKVNIHFSSYPDNEFGTVRGIVSSISLVPSKIGANENYIVEIKLPNGLLTTYKKELPFLPGMEGQADIITDDLTLLERFLLPLKKVLSESV